jgi:hypothetical protein
METHARFDGPALVGAENVVLPGRDHRETSFDPEAFASAYRFITGRTPDTRLVPEVAPVLDGRVTGFRGNDPTNLPLSGASVEVYEVSRQTGERLGPAVHAKTVGADGQWGPFAAKPDAHYEFVLRADGFAVTHLYRSPFPRGSSIVHMRPARLSEADRAAGGSLVAMSRPRGYFGVGRDRMSLDGLSPPPGVPSGVPGVTLPRTRVAGDARAVVAEFNGERIVVRSWPVQENHAVIAEFHY